MASGKSRHAHNQPGAQTLFESKLHPPSTRPAVVSRSALVDRLVKSDGAPITSIVAPPGYGKTTLLSEWAHREDTHLAWLSLDRYDNDLSQFVSYTAAALERIENIDPALLRPVARNASVAAAASGVASAMAAMARPVTLVLDHVESLENRQCLDTVAELALHLPPGARLALATRVDPPLPVPRLRAGGEIVEIGVDDLAMDNAEARLLLEKAGVHLADGDLEDVIERAEGWPVGLYLAALALKSGGSRETAGIAFSGDDRLVAEYLRAELLDNLSREDVTFLTRTALLDRMSGALCDAVLEADGSARVLESLAHSNLLLVSLDRHGEWYRYHHLFRDLLRAELTRREPQRVATLHVRASDWFDENDLPEMAIDHAQAGGDADRVNRLLLMHAGAMYASGRSESLHRWMTWFEGRGLVEHYPALGIVGAMVFSGSARAGEVERWAAAAERASDESSQHVLPDGSTIEGWLALLRLALCREGLDGMKRDAEIAETGLSARSGYRATALAFEGLGYLAAGELDRADAVLAHAVAIASEMTRMATAVPATALRGFIACMKSDWRAADTFASDALTLIEMFGLERYAESGLVYVLCARIAVRRGDAAAATDYLRQGALLRPLQTYARPLLSVETLLELARSYADAGDTAGAREVIRQSREILLQRPDLGTLPAQLDALELRLETMRTGSVGASSLTAAELRLVPYLPTHLTFPEIAQRLHVSRNTAKSQAISIYQKLGVSSRAAAVEQLDALGFLG